MKKLLKTLLCTVCIMSMVIPVFNTVSASMNDVIFDLTSLGVLDDADAVLPLEDNMTRAEFANLVVAAMGYDDLAQTMIDKGYFGDLGASPYVGEINLLYELNILSGTDEGVFSPDVYVTYSQVGKIMVNILGYSSIVKDKDLNSYFYMAGILGVFDDVSTTEGFVNRADAYIIIHNCLDIDVMSANYSMFGTGSYDIQEGKTLKSNLQKVRQDKLIKMKGIVTGDCETYIFEEYGINKTNIIEIDGVTYKCNFDVPSGLVGMAVDFYVANSEESGQFIASIAPSDKNCEVEFELTDLSGVVADEIRYFENDAEKKFRYNETTKLIYNGRRDFNSGISAIKNYENGTLRAIDNNEDGIYDIVYVYEYNDVIVKRLYNETKQVYFDKNQVVDGARYVSFDDEDAIIRLTDTEGNTVKFDEIPLDSVLSFAKSKDNKVITAIISDKKITGKVNIIEDDYVTIGTDVVKCSPYVSVNLGNHIEAYVNFMDVLVYAEETVSYENYGYVYTVSAGNGFDNAKVAIITPGHINETSESVFSDEGGEESKNKKLFFRNSGKEIFVVSNNVTLNSRKSVKTTDAYGNEVTVKYKKSDILNMVSNQVVCYTLNDKGEIVNFDIIEPYDTDTYKKYYQNGKVFSYGDAGDGFGINDAESMSICIPKNISTCTDDDFMIPVMLLTNTKYEIKAYDVDETSHIAGLVVVTSDMKAGMINKPNADSDVGIVKKVSKKIIDDEEKLVINLITDEGEKNYAVSPLISQNEFLAASAGDLIAFNLINGTDEMNGIKILQDSNNYNTKDLNTSNPQFEFCLGTVADARYDYVSQTKGRWTDEVTIDYGTSTAKYEVYNSNTPPIFLLEDSSKIEKLTFDDIQIGDKIFVSAKNGAVRAIVIRR